MRAILVCGVVFLAAIQAADSIYADDSVGASPTTDNSAVECVKQLSREELSKIELPTDAEKTVFSFNFVARGGNDQRSDALPLLRVRADGEFECGNRAERYINVGTPEIRRSGVLSKDELQWLLHLAINDCKMLLNTTASIEHEIEMNSKPTTKTSDVGQSAAESRLHDVYVFEVANRVASNKVEIPEKALISRSLRRKAKLDSVARLTTYANFLTMRAVLGDEKQVTALLSGLNDKLRVDFPDCPPFRIDHLRSAASIAGSDVLKKLSLSATFEQEFSADGGGQKRIIGQVQQHQEKDLPQFVVWEI
ncbi:MAG: hypothetical protein JNL18_17760 [Planctomycetaceae bacterium]|nr:hypothetical protein [Planctomycetaceae bacterium]